MVSAQFLWGNVFPGGELQINAKKFKFGNFLKVPSIWNLGVCKKKTKTKTKTKKNNNNNKQTKQQKTALKNLQLKQRLIIVDNATDGINSKHL